MAELLTAAQMRAIEKAAIDSGQVTGLELMERAGQGVVEAIFEEWPTLGESSHHAVVLCGPGNNGGDGFVVARLLHRDGWEVEVFLYGDPDKLPSDARANYERWCELREVQEASKANTSQGARPAVLVDALFGIGVNRCLPLDLAEAVHAVRKRPDEKRNVGICKLIAVDCPSGTDSDSGKLLLPKMPPETGDEAQDIDAHMQWWKNEAVPCLLLPEMTVTFHRRKIGHAVNEHLGKLRVVDIGLGREFLETYHLLEVRNPDVATLLDFSRHEKSANLKWPWRDVQKGRPHLDHKYSYGHVLILSGTSGKTGATRLAARGALRIGAGLVTLGVPKDAQLEVASQITAVMMTQVDDAQDLTDALADDRINALCLGPGLGLERARALVPVALNDPERHVVLDADALSAFADDPKALFDMLHENCVLTPHGGEFARLFPDIAEKLNAPPTTGPAYSKVDATRAAAKRAGCTVLFKGPDTVIASPSGICAINAALYERAAPWLATAGSGDVLAGFITGLLARGFAPQSAAETAAWLHVECARIFGPGLIAEDIPEQLPQVLRNCRKNP